MICCRRRRRRLSVQVCFGGGEIGNTNRAKREKQRKKSESVQTSMDPDV